MGKERVIDRFDRYMEYKRLSDNKVTNQLGLSNGVIGKSRKEGRDLSDRVLEKIEKYYKDINSGWLRYYKRPHPERTGPPTLIHLQTKTYKDNHFQ